MGGVQEGLEELTQFGAALGMLGMFVARADVGVPAAGLAALGLVGVDVRKGDQFGACRTLHVETLVDSLQGGAGHGLDACAVAALGAGARLL